MSKKYDRQRNANDAITTVKSQNPKFDFDAWWATVENKIPKHHHKEIIKADFLARGLSTNESMSDYNEALKRYGIRLK